MLEKIEQLIKESEVSDLYNEVIKTYKITFQKNTKNGWASEIMEDNKAIILFSETNYLKSCLAHELLHLKIQADGYKKPTLMNSGEDSDDDFVSLTKDYSEELMHHKIYPMFIELGLTKEEFYNYNDSENFIFLDQALTILKKQDKHGKINLIDLARICLTIIAPGGSIEENKKNDLKRKLKYINKSILGNIDQIFSDWKAQDSLDPTSFLKRFLLLLGCNGKFWISLLDNPMSYPADGFFISD